MKKGIRIKIFSSRFYSTFHSALIFLRYIDHHLHDSVKADSNSVLGFEFNVFSNIGDGEFWTDVANDGCCPHFVVDLKNGAKNGKLFSYLIVSVQ